MNVFSPASPEASDLLRLWNACLWVCIFILAVVTVSICWSLIRYRRRDDRVPTQTTGNLNLELIWTGVPVVIVSVLFVLSVMTARAVDKPFPGRNPDIIVTGHQWWWEVQYPAAHVTTANEVHIPVGQDMLLDIEAADVIHDFWAPELTRKIDAIPGKHNYIWISADHPGNYYGACAEFCGAQHAWMRFRVVGDQPGVYQQWLVAQAQSAAPAPAGDAAAGEKRFKDLTCVNCHNIQGVNQQKQFAPDLTHVASRAMLAAERLQNTQENMRDWLHRPNIIKPGCYMPNLNLSEADLTILTAYLETLK